MIQTQRYSIAAVVVTYNRLHLLQQVIAGLQSQTIAPSTIIVVNNGSTDGTEEWLKASNNLRVVHQGNSGSSGGQHTGFAEAMKTDCTHIWCMDDDVVPDNSCLEELLKYAEQFDVCAPLRIEPNGETLFYDTTAFNFRHATSSLWKKQLAESDILKEWALVEGCTFEGPLIRRSVVDAIGLPDKEFFIFADDSDFFIRSSFAGFSSAIIRDAKLSRKIPVSDSSPEWKRYYEMRNLTQLDRRYGSLSVRWMRPILYCIKFLLRARSFSEIAAIIQGTIHGYADIMGKRP